MLKAIVPDVIDLLRHFEFETAQKNVPFCRQSKVQSHKWDITEFKDKKYFFILKRRIILLLHFSESEKKIVNAMIPLI